MLDAQNSHDSADNAPNGRPPLRSTADRIRPNSFRAPKRTVPRAIRHVGRWPAVIGQCNRPCFGQPEQACQTWSQNPRETFDFPLSIHRHAWPSVHHENPRTPRAIRTLSCKARAVRDPHSLEVVYSPESMSGVLSIPAQHRSRVGAK